MKTGGEILMRRVLLIGATGRLGRHFVPALSDLGYEVLLLLRPVGQNSVTGYRQSLIDALTRQGAKVLDGSLQDADSLDRACAEADGVVSCIDHQPEHLKLQLALARAAARSGRVKRFIPSQFGIDSRLYEQSRVGHGDTKRELQQQFAASGVPTTYVHANGFANIWAAGLGQLGLEEPPRGHIEVYGDGNVKFSMVAPEDIARYAARALFDSWTENRHTSITPAENLFTQNQLIELWEAKTRRRLKRRQISSRELDDRIASLARAPDRLVELALAQLIRAAWIDGLGNGRRLPEVLELTELYPEVQYLRMSQILDSFVAIAAASNEGIGAVR
jgi:phenylcoumaran benzylic ether reductase